MKKTIDSFAGEYRFLSNFYPSEIEVNGKLYPTVEHAYQALKTDDEDAQEQIRLSETPGEAKRRGKKVALSVCWDEIKISVMTLLVYTKFVQNPELRQALLDTGDDELIEGNWWGDTFWGMCRTKYNGKEIWQGQNHLGQILMSLRDGFRKGLKK